MFFVNKKKSQKSKFEKKKKKVADFQILLLWFFTRQTDFGVSESNLHRSECTFMCYDHGVQIS